MAFQTAQTKLYGCIITQHSSHSGPTNTKHPCYASQSQCQTLDPLAQPAENCTGLCSLLLMVKRGPLSSQQLKEIKLQFLLYVA